jgi:hypothetical protein
VSRFECGLCAISPSQDRFTGDRETVYEHIEGHNVADPSDYLSPTTEQATL